MFLVYCVLLYFVMYLLGPINLCLLVFVVTLFYVLALTYTCSISNLMCYFLINFIFATLKTRKNGGI